MRELFLTSSLISLILLTVGGFLLSYGVFILFRKTKVPGKNILFSSVIIFYIYYFLERALINVNLSPDIYRYITKISFYIFPFAILLLGVGFFLLAKYIHKKEAIR